MSFAGYMLLQEPFRKAGFGMQAFHGVTTIHPLGLAAIILLGIACLLVRRHHAALPFLLLAALVPAAQRVVVFTLDFNLLRLLVLVGVTRILLRGEYRSFKWNRIDALVFAWSLCGAIAYITFRGTVSDAIFKIGRVYDTLGLYFYLRCVVRDWSDVRIMVRAVCLLSIPLVFVFAREQTTGSNWFSFLGAPEFTIERGGRMRAQGPFPHPILAGCFFAAWWPLMYALTKDRRHRTLGTVGLIAATGIIFFCASSTPVGGLLAAFVGLAAWPLRRNMRTIRWCVLLGLIGLHLVMKAPVWHLLSRISFSQGSTSYHRYLLIDNAIRHFNEWALIGTGDTGHWGHAMYDLTNQFVREGVRGGLLALILFCSVFVASFASIGRTWRAVAADYRLRWMAWALGVGLFVQATMFISISISHSQQNQVAFYFVLASMGSLEALTRRGVARPTTRTPRSPRRVQATPAGS